MMTRFFSFLLTPLLLISITLTAYSAELVTVVRADNAKVPVRVYQPVGNGCEGTVIISHGAGGSEEGYAYFARFLSDNGWLALVIGHAESGRDALRSHKGDGSIKAGLVNLVTDPAAYQARFLDIDAGRQWAAQHCQSPFMALAGHSMGAATVMMEAGADNKPGIVGQHRFDAYIALSPQGSGLIFPKQAWDNIHQPVLMLTGTRDEELNNEWSFNDWTFNDWTFNDWTRRLEPFDNMPEGCKWLGVIDRATHMNFGGRGISGKTEALVNRYALLFLSQVKDGHCSAPPSGKGIELKSK